MRRVVQPDQDPRIPARLSGGGRATGAAVRTQADDAVVATYREHGHGLLKGMTARKVMAEMYGKITRCNRLAETVHAPVRQGERLLRRGNAIPAEGFPAIGLALADKMLDRDRVTVYSRGRATMAEGE